MGNKKNKVSSVNLRQNKTKGGMVSLFLDFYPPITNPKTGKLTRREFLGLYIHENPKDKAEKVHNKETMDKATVIRIEREKTLLIQNPNVKSEKAKTKLADYAKEIITNYNGSTKKTWNYAMGYLNNFLDSSKLNEVTLEGLDIDFCKKYKTYLEGVEIHTNSKALYLTKFKTLLRKAYQDEIIHDDYASKLKNINIVETEIQYLTMDEINKLAKTPLKKEHIKKFALFSALTGFRTSDIKKLTWGDIVQNGDIYEIHYRQKKTGKVEISPVSKQAVELLGERQSNEKIVFEDKALIWQSSINNSISMWLKASGIDKHISMHCFRHTFATLQLEAGTDIYTVSKMLGHKSISTTQRYAKVVDKTKREASNRIVIDFGAK